MIPEIKPEVEYHDFLFDRGEISFDELIYIKGAKTPPETGRRTRQVLSKHGKKHEYLSIVYRRLVFGGCKEVYGQGVIVEGLDNAAYEIGVDRNNLLYLIERGYITPCPRNKGQKYKFILDDLLEGYEKRKQEIIDTMRENNDWGE